MAALDHDLLLAMGVTLIMAGIFLRGFAATTRRDLERRRQHLRDDRREEAAGRGGNMERPPTWLEKNLGLIANLTLLAGAIITAVGFWRR